MRFQNKVTEECRELLLRQLERYESEMEMTKEERKELHKCELFKKVTLTKFY